MRHIISIISQFIQRWRDAEDRFWKPLEYQYQIALPIALVLGILSILSELIRGNIDFALFIGSFLLIISAAAYLLLYSR